MSLRRRLALMTTSLLVVGYLIFACVSVGVLETTLRGFMDSKLSTIARAASDIIDDDRGRPAVRNDAGRPSGLTFQHCAQRSASRRP